MSFEKELEVARRAARVAGEIALRYRAQGVAAEIKDDLSPVTVADKECEKAIVATLLEAFPDDGVMGEEGARRDAVNGRMWIIDPIDGTRDFLRGNRLFANLIGLELDGEVVAGVVNLPALGELYSASRGAGAYRDDGTQLKVSSIVEKDQAVVCLSGINSASWRERSERIPAWCRGFWSFRSLGGCADAMMVAAGQAEIYLEPKVSPWDMAPLKIVVEEAGGRFFNFDGGSSIYGGNCVCCAPGLEGEARRFLGLD
ncbi:MAG: inositol monophosphatase family protein [Bryobacteraceae bacterium]